MKKDNINNINNIDNIDHINKFDNRKLNLTANRISGINQNNEIEAGEDIDSDTYKKLLGDIKQFQQEINSCKEDEKGKPKKVSNKIAKIRGTELFSVYNELMKNIVSSNLKESIKKELQEDIAREFKSTVNVSLENTACCSSCAII